MKPKEEFITLKEAAAISGYAPDYVGQLIRAGKIPGKQVFSNVSWVTTEQAIREYVERSKKNPEARTQLQLFQSRITSPEMLTGVYVWTGWMVVGACSLFVLLLFYVFSVSIDHAIEKQYLEKIHHAQ